MKRAPRDSFGKVRTTREEFESLGMDSWWMHEMCMNATDSSEYYGVPSHEPGSPAPQPLINEQAVEPAERNASSHHPPQVASAQAPAETPTQAPPTQSTDANASSGPAKDSSAPDVRKMSVKQLKEFLNSK